MTLRRPDVLNGALEQLDRDGLDNLTMQALAKALGVRPGALYWHYESKAALIDAMAEAIIGQVEIPEFDADEPWDQRLVEMCTAIHAALISHRDGARLFAGTYIGQGSSARVGSATIQVLVDAGLAMSAATEASFTLFYFILGYTIEEQAQLQLSAAGSWQKHVDRLAENTPPEIAAAVTEAQSFQPGHFQRGLGLVIEGIRQQLAVRAGAAASA